MAGVLLVVFQGGLLARAVDAEERLSAELAERARQLEESAAELEMTNEELHLANEQQQYTVEELQTATEELETSNEQLHVANDDLVRSRDDLAARQVALRASEEQFRTLAQHLPVSLFVCRADGATLYVNPAWTLMTGVPAEEALSGGWAATVHPDDAARVRREWTAALDGHDVVIDCRHLRPDGVVRHVRTTSATVRHPAGHTTVVLGTGST